MNPKVTTLEIFIDKDGGQKKEWNIVMASDIHTGTIINRTRFNRLVSEINALDPDLVLLTGDTVDEDIKPVIQNDIGEALANIHSRYGIYGVTGNHEYIGGIEEAEKYLTEHGVILLRDQHVLIDDSFELVGREDHSAGQFNGSGAKRKTLDELLAGVDLKRPVIILDHQPFNLADLAADSWVDFQLSGHTHNGQLWPFNFITSAIYEVSQGYKRIGNTQFYVSSGWGTWGPPIRTSASPELVNLKLKFK